MEEYVPQLQTASVLRDDTPPGQPPVDTLVGNPGWEPEPNKAIPHWYAVSRIPFKSSQAPTQRTQVPIYQRLMDYICDIHESMEEMGDALLSAIDQATRPAPRKFSSAEKIVK